MIYKRNSDIINFLQYFFEGIVFFTEVGDDTILVQYDSYEL